MTEPLRRRPPATIARPAVPMSPNVPGMEFVPRVDRVLQHLAREGDEREWVRMMETSDAISSAIRQRQQGLLEKGWEIRPGESGSDNAAKLRDFIAAVFARRSLRLEVVLPEMLDVVFLGWRPIEVLYDAELTFDGSPVLAPTKLIARKPWQFKFTHEGEGLAYMPRGSMPGTTVFPLPGPMPRRWLTPSAGESESPYGRSWLSAMWLLWFTSNQFKKMSSQAIKRSLGLFKAIRKGGTIADSETVATSGIDTALRSILAILDANSIVVEAGDWSLERLETATMGSETRDFQTYFDEQLRIGIVGQTLTTKVGDTGGAFAVGKVHEGILESYQRSDAQLLAGTLDHLIEIVVDANFGPQPPADYPCWHPLKFQRFDAEVTRFAYDAGAAIDARQLRKQGAPIVLGEPAEGVEVLQKQPVATTPPAPPAPTAPRPETDSRSRAQGDAESAASLLAGFAGGREFAKLYGSAARRLLEGNPDP